MMITLKENTASSTSQPIDYQTNTIHHSTSNINYNYHHHHQNPWEKPTYATFDYQSTPYSMGTMSSTGGITSLEPTTTNKSNSSFDIALNLNPSPGSFYRRHTESTLPTSTSIYSSSSTPNHPSPTPFHYSHPTTHYQPAELFFGWNNGPSLMRTHSASYRDYPQSTSFPRYHPANPLSATTTNKPATSQIQTGLINPPTSHHYPSYFPMMPPLNMSFPSVTSNPSNSTSQQKRSIPSGKKRPRLTAQLRNEILKLKANQPTIFVWEIQQNLLQNGICTPQTLPDATVIQRMLNKSVSIIKSERKPHVDLVMKTLFTENNKLSPVTICLSPSQSPALSDGESGSECSICLETYRSGQEVSILSCSHEYHSTCIKEWMIKNRSCPMCRKDIHNQPQFVTLLI